MNMNGFKQMLKKHVEVLIFFIVIGLNLIPVFSGKFFPSMDGASHLNNAQLIKELLLGSNTFLKDFFVFNPEPVPNWIGHFILVFFKMFLPSYLAEKALLLIYFIGLPLAFRKLINTISPNNSIYSFFIFPFTYSAVFLLGFYNFSIAIILFLLTLNYWIIVQRKKITIKKLGILFLLVTTTYFSHIFLFAILLMSISLQIILSSILDYTNNPKEFKKIFSNVLKLILTIVSVSIIPFSLFLFYVISRDSLQNNSIVPIEDLISWIKNIRPIIAYNPPLEEAFTTKIFYVITVLAVIGVYLEFNNLFTNKFSKKILVSTILTLNNTWFFIVSILLIMYFFLPLADDGDTGGFFKVRLGLLFFIMFIIWISTLKVSRWMNIIAVSIVIFFHLKLNNYYSTVIKELDFQAQECYKAAEVIPENSVVLPLNFSNHWLQGHFSNYLGSDKTLIILENYECDKGYFPLLWNKEKYSNFLLDGKTPDEIECLWWKTDLNNEKKQIDYVFILGDINTIFDACIQTNILYKFEKIYQGSGCTVFKVN